jgi:hypothetical protein
MTLQEELGQRSTEELISILRNRDEEEWQPEVFAVVAALLKERGVSPDDVAALGPEPVEQVESAPTVTIATFFNAAEAHASRMALEDAGIQAWVADEAGGTLYGIAIGSRLQVREGDAERAREALAAPTVPAGDLPPELAEPPCPSCASKNVALEARVDPDAEGRELMGTRRRWYHVCAACRHTWPAEDEPA